MNMIENFERERAAVAEMCAHYGYGFVMAEASKLWQQSADAKGFSHGKLVGPHRSGTEPCQCVDEPVGCDWCQGCGWLTKKVAELQRREND